MTNKYNSEIDDLIKGTISDRDRAVFEQVLQGEQEVGKELKFREDVGKVLGWRKQLQEAHQWMLDNQQSEDIDNYVKDKMSPEEVADFELLMAADKDLQEEVSFRQSIKQVLKMKRQITQAHKNHAQKASLNVAATSTQEATVRTLGVRRLLSYAAGVCMLLIAGSLGYADSNFSNAAIGELSPHKLELNGKSSFKGATATAEDVFDIGLTAIEKEEWTNANSFFQQFSDGQPHYDAAQLYLAYINYQQADYETSIQNAATVIQAGNMERQAKAEWLTIQSMLAIDQTGNNFQTLLQKIATQKGHPFKKEALRLQEELNSFWRGLVF